MFRIVRRFLMTLSLVLFLPSSVPAEDAAPILHVATFLLPPYVMKQGDSLTGFSIELWQHIAAKLNVGTSFEVLPDVNAVLQAVETRQTDIGVSGIFITADRDRDADFSVSILNAGLQIMVPETGQMATPRPLQDLFHLVFSSTAAIWLAVALLIIVLPAHLIWWLDRGNEKGISPGRSYFPGILHAMTWTATALFSQAQQLPQHMLARFLAVIWMFVALVFIALYIAQLTATLTVEQIRGGIDGPSDLPGKRVGTIIGSTSAAYLREIHAEVVEFQQADDMYKALLDKKLDAILFSAPTLLYYAAHEGAGLVKLVGSEFHKLDLGIFLPLNSPLRKKIDVVLLSLREDGTYQQIYDKWFGIEQGGE